MIMLYIFMSYLSYTGSGTGDMAIFDYAIFVMSLVLCLTEFVYSLLFITYITYIQ